MSSVLTVLVTGATGHQGGALARQLLDRNHRVRLFTRKPQSFAAREMKARGAELFVGDFDDPESLREAMEGADAVFAMATPIEAGVVAEIRHARNQIDVAKSTAIAHFVYSSAAGADQNTGIPYFDSKAKIEAYLDASRLPYTVIRPAYFMENLLGPMILPELQAGRLSLPLPASRKLQQIALVDLASFVVMALENRQDFLGHKIDLASDELTFARCADLLSIAIGRPIEYVQAPLERIRAISEDLAKMFEWFDKAGYAVDINGLRQRYASIEWHTFEQWAEAQDWSVLEKVA